MTFIVVLRILDRRACGDQSLGAQPRTHQLPFSDGSEQFAEQTLRSVTSSACYGEVLGLRRGERRLQPRQSELSVALSKIVIILQRRTG